MNNLNVKNLKTYLLVLVDVILIAFAMGAAIIIRANIEFSIISIQVTQDFPIIQPYIFVIFSIIWIIVFAHLGIYKQHDRFSYSLLLELILASILALMFTAGFIKFINDDFSRILLILFGLLATIFLIIPRVLLVVFSKKDITISHLIKNLIIPLITLLLYSSSVTLTTHLWFPKGVNYFFSMRLNIILIFTISILLVSVFYIYIEKWNKIEFCKLKFNKIEYYEVSLLLLPLTSFVTHALNNRDILVFLDIVLMGIIILAILIIYILIIPFLLSPISNKHILLGIGVSFVYTIINMASLSQSFAWYEVGKFSIQFLLFIGFFFVVWLLLKLKNKRDIVIVVIAFLIGNILVQLPKFGSSEIMDEDPMVHHPLFEALEGKKLSRNPNIYFLVYESYAPDETMLGYGIDNIEQVNFLEDFDFKLYPHTYSIGGETLRSISRVLNVSPEFYGDLRRAVSGDSVATNILSEYGYKTYGVFPYDFMFRGIGSSYDISIPSEITQTLQLLLSGILVGEFRFDLELELEFYNMTWAEFLQERNNAFKDIPEQHVFFYTHFPIPGHSQNSGQCAPGEIEIYS